jgi:hypothetical protein
MKLPLFFPRSLLLLAMWSPGGYAQWFADVAGETLYTDNLSRSRHDNHAREDLSVNLAARGGYHLQPAIYTGLTLTGTASHTRYDTYSGLDSLEATLGASVDHKFGIGDRVPVLSLATSINRSTYDVDVRDAWIHSVGVSLFKRLTETFSLTATLNHEYRDADHDKPRTPMPPAGGGAAPAAKPGNPWRFDTLSFSLQGELDLDELTWLSGGYSIHKGDVVSSSPSFADIVQAANAITDDPAFGPAIIAYRIPAYTRSLSLAWNRAVLQSGTLYLGFDYQKSSNSSGINYDVSIVRAGYIHGF